MLNQAFASASTVENEPLTSSFEGLLGLALPLNSVISKYPTALSPRVLCQCRAIVGSKIPAGVGDSADGAVFSSNLFSLTGGEGAPSQRFISLSLSRPGTSKYPALLGLGRHPTQVPGYENNIDELKKKVPFLTQGNSEGGIDVFFRFNTPMFYNKQQGLSFGSPVSTN